ncbi:MAG: Ig-like domain-containing protein, partial [Saprospiraceae bacterium]|nr:Ig-like domain-containing protein [Saprospiraceae bacterium]
MQKIVNTYTLPLGIFMMVLLIFSCKKEMDDSFPITNDFRLLQVKINGNAEPSGAENVAADASLELVFSHAINTANFEGSLSISPAVTYTLSYDNSGSIVTLVFDNPLDYETMYTLSLAQGSYGAGGQSSTAAITYNFTTRPFSAPNITLSAAAPDLFEGESLTIEAEISFPILVDVTVDLEFAGDAEKDTDYTVDVTSLTIPAGSTSATAEITALNDGDTEGGESIIVTLANLVNAIEAQTQRLELTLGDQPPALTLKGVMSLKIGGTSTNGRAIHLRALEDIADLSVYGIGIANNGGGSDGREIDFPAMSANQGDDILLVRDIDEAGLSAFFGDFWSDYEVVVTTPDLNFNGDDPFELYNGTAVIETYGDVELQGTGLEWEYTGSWAYKIKGFWEYGQVDCAINATTLQEANCVYPFVAPVQMYGILAILWDGSGTNGGKCVHLRAHRDIPDLSIYGLGVANNGGGTDGLEITLPAMSLNEGDHILIAREPATISAYFGGCIDGYAEIIQSDGMNQNGDDAIELFNGMDVVETYGDADVDGTGQSWDYEGTWAFRANGVWTKGDVNCAAGSTTTQSSACPYGFCN